jgi:hypothetical protein
MKHKHYLPALALGLSICTGLGTAFAEQPAAETNRQIMSSKNYTLRYSSGKNQWTVMENGGTRAVIYSYNGKFYNRTVFSDGNYYHMEQGDKGIVATLLPASELDNPALDPAENWRSNVNDLALPQALLILDWDNPFNRRPTSWERPTYRDSGTQTIAKQTYDIDTYVGNVRTAAGTVAGQVLYRLGYQGGVLKLVEINYLQDGVETPGRQYMINELTAGAPGNMFGYKQVNLYAAGLGDMDDLLERPAVIGKIGGNT